MSVKEIMAVVLRYAETIKEVISVRVGMGKA